MDLVGAYYRMYVIRLFEETCMALHRDGDITGSIHLCIGQEAIPVGGCAALDDGDSLTGTYRGHGWAIARGVPLEQLFAELMGRDSDLCGGRGGSASTDAQVGDALSTDTTVLPRT